MKRVFRIGQFMKDMYKIGYWWSAFNAMTRASTNWVRKCDGLSKEEAAELGLVIEEDWMVDDYGL